ncbi:hypothetical protein LguiB_013217 [Lonicera macranthoides]
MDLSETDVFNDGVFVDGDFIVFPLGEVELTDTDVFNVGDIVTVLGCHPKLGFHWT